MHSSLYHARSCTILQSQNALLSLSLPSEHQSRHLVHCRNQPPRCPVIRLRVQVLELDLDLPACRLASMYIYSGLCRVLYGLHKSSAASCWCLSLWFVARLSAGGRGSDCLRPKLHSGLGIWTWKMNCSRTCQGFTICRAKMSRGSARLRHLPPYLICLVFKVREDDLNIRVCSHGSDWHVHAQRSYSNV